MAEVVPAGLAVPCLLFFGVLRQGQGLVHELIRGAGGAGGRKAENGSYLLLSFPKLFYPEDKNLDKIKKRGKAPAARALQRLRSDTVAALLLLTCCSQSTELTHSLCISPAENQDAGAQVQPKSKD